MKKFIALLILLCNCANIYAQNNTAPSEEDLVNAFANKILKEAKWTKVTTTVGDIIFYIDTVSLKRIDNSVNFWQKQDKRGNIEYLETWGDCLTDAFSLTTGGFKKDIGKELVNRPTKYAGTAQPNTAIYEMLGFACKEGAKSKTSFMPLNTPSQGDTKDVPPKRVLSLLEVASDQPGFLGVKVKTNGTLKISTEYKGIYSDAQSTHFSFEIYDANYDRIKKTATTGTFRGYLYMQRGEKSDKIRRILLEAEGRIVASIIFIIVPGKLEKYGGNSVFIAEMIDLESFEL